MTVCGLTARCINIIEQREALYERMLIRYGRREDRKRRSAITPGYVPQHLVMGAILFNDQKNMLDKRWFADVLGNRCRCSMRVDVLRSNLGVRGQIPVIVREDLLAKILPRYRIRYEVFEGSLAQYLKRRISSPCGQCE
jgi:hypothetical protein